MRDGRTGLTLEASGRATPRLPSSPLPPRGPGCLVLVHSRLPFSRHDLFAYPSATVDCGRDGGEVTDELRTEPR